MTRASAVLALVVCIVLGRAERAHAETPLRVGSKRFTESYILAELVVAAAKAEGIAAVHERGLGGTAVTYRALEDGAIDVYPEYTGTIADAIVKDGRAEIAELQQALAPRGIAISAPLGFENTYAIAGARSARVSRVSELARRPDLRIGLSHEFAGRTDGWPGLAKRYGLAHRPTTIDHALAYEALRSGSIDLTDVYTTDAKIARYDLVVLDDDRRFFPPYESVLLYRIDVPRKFPAFERVLRRLAGAIDVQTMRKLNARVELDGVSFHDAAAEFLAGASGASAPTSPRRSFLSGLGESIVRHGPRHLELVLGSLLLATLVGVPLGVLAYARRRAGAIILGVTGVVQTIPSLALFCFLIPILGIGPVPALVALFLYGLLPIVRNTHAGLTSIPSELRDAARALGLSAVERLRHVEIPLAARTILAGIKTSAVVAVGSATIAAFIGAGGFGEPISTGLSLNDVPTILEGAIPAAVLALLMQWLFAILEESVVAKGLKTS